MTPFEKQQLRQLIWKEGRQVCEVLALALGVFFFLALLPAWFPIPFEDALFIGVGCAACIAAFGLGVVSYGLELNDHTQTFLATRPIAHSKVFIVKLLWTQIPVSLLALITFAVSGLPDPVHYSPVFLILYGKVLLGAPLVPLAIEFMILSIPSMIPALILSISAGIGAIAILYSSPWWVSAGLICLYLYVNYHYSRWRMRGPGW